MPKAGCVAARPHGPGRGDSTERPAQERFGAPGDARCRVPSRGPAAGRASVRRGLGRYGTGAAQATRRGSAWPVALRAPRGVGVAGGWAARGSGGVAGSQYAGAGWPGDPRGRVPGAVGRGRVLRPVRPPHVPASVGHVHHGHRVSASRVGSPRPAPGREERGLGSRPCGTRRSGPGTVPAAHCRGARRSRTGRTFQPTAPVPDVRSGRRAGGGGAAWRGAQPGGGAALRAAGVRQPGGRAPNAGGTRGPPSAAASGQPPTAGVRGRGGWVRREFGGACAGRGCAPTVGVRGPRVGPPQFGEARKDRGCARPTGGSASVRRGQEGPDQGAGPGRGSAGPRPRPGAATPPRPPRGSGGTHRPWPAPTST